nr:hypothetical protein [Tanacetum cinerariifolium]
MQEMVWFRRLKNMIRMFRGFKELSQLRERQMFNATTAMEEATMHVIVQNPEFVTLNNTLEELSVTVIMMEHIQTTDDKLDAEPTYDAELISE